MKLSKRTLLKSALSLALATTVGFSATASAQTGGASYIMATATTGGTYYPVGVALATLVKVKLEPTMGISVSAISSAGSGENLKLMDENQVQFSILQGLYGGWAWTGTGDVPKQYENIRSVSMLWQNVEHFVIHNRHVTTGTITDIGNLGNSGFSIGARNSGTEGSGRQILKGVGIDPDSLNLAYMGYGPSAEGMQNGTIRAMNIPAGAPAAAVTSAFANMARDIKVLDFTDEQIQQVNSDFELWTRFVIPAGTYPGQTEDINTVSQPNILAVNADVPEEHVYQITKAMYENLPFLNNIHPATRDMAIEKAIEGLPLPLHKGAARYLTEQGIDIPARLLVD
ncbi:MULTISPECIES: TAXI family TRAP transporter solute-binding subunit [Nitrincola]|uniref:TRAP transporter solute receptor, TAXI family n=1 Tax=Nitrincola nitratireducens TaxID=1229521 RepID=W9VQY7_9GAMM|nr:MULTISPECIES: TAXI family TRAP transporter solute-binding subunit [Nitrincola]EXJ12820.1 TRAP transporter solute receptor, TAXI family [Nitrincola nitratireducens]